MMDKKGFLGLGDTMFLILGIAFVLIFFQFVFSNNITERDDITLLKLQEINHQRTLIDYLTTSYQGETFAELIVLAEDNVEKEKKLREGTVDFVQKIINLKPESIVVKYQKKTFWMGSTRTTNRFRIIDQEVSGTTILVTFPLEVRGKMIQVELHSGGDISSVFDINE
jgi:hypothetical protein